MPAEAMVAAARAWQATDQRAWLRSRQPWQLGYNPTLAAATVAEFVLATFVEAQEQKRLEALAEACELPEDNVVEVDAQSRDAAKPTTR